MRLDGDGMLVGVKDAVKLIGIVITACCAVFVCTMFLNYYFDIITIEGKLTSDMSIIFYQAQVSTAKLVCSIAGGCLLMTSIIMLLFYIKHYIDTHKKELGILKALGYSNWKIAKNFWVFGCSVLLGTALGFAGAFLIMPEFYKLQNEEQILPDISIHFHPTVVFCFVIAPTLLFAVLAICYAWIQLKRPVLWLLKENFQANEKSVKHKEEKSSGRPFISDLKRDTLRTRKILVFFILFASFCFSSMTQMSLSMKELSSEMMGIIMLVIGLVLAFTTLLLSITTVMNSNKKTMIMMRVFGYSQKECFRAIFGGYRPVSYLGFVLGTVYQYILLRITVDIVFRDMGNIPDYEFDIPVMMMSLAVFLAAYEIVMYAYYQKIKHVSIKEIMLE